MAGAIAAVGLAVLCAATSQLYYVHVLYSVLIGLGLGYALSLGVRIGRYGLGVRWTVLLYTLLTYTLFNTALYAMSVYGVAGVRPDFLEFMAFRAARQELPLGIEPDPRLNAGVWAIEIGLSAWIASYLARRSTVKVRLESVPTSVTEFVLYLLFQGRGTADVQAALANHGWTKPADVLRVFEAADAAISMIRASDRSPDERE